MSVNGQGLFPVVYIDVKCIDELHNDERFLQYAEQFGLAQDIYNHINEKHFIYIDSDQKLFYVHPKHGSRKFIEITYESIIAIAFDLEKKKSVCATAVLKHGLRWALMIEKGIDVEVIEVRGKQLFTLIDIGQVVYEGSQLCYIVTKKYEVRVVKCPVKGVVFYIGEVFSKEGRTLYIIIVGEDNVTKLARAP